MTLTYPVINRARRVLWVVTGSEKGGEFCAACSKATRPIPAGRVPAETMLCYWQTEQRRNSWPLSKNKEDSMRVGIATDHGGFGLKEQLVAHLRDAGHEVVDYGAHTLNDGDDYPDFVTPLARDVAAGKVERGVAVCGSGVGASVCANKVPGVRAGLVSDHFSARQGVEDDHMNIICMGGRTAGPLLSLGHPHGIPGS